MLKNRLEREKEVNQAVRNSKSLKQLKFGGNYAGIIDARWAINEAPVPVEVSRKRSIYEYL